jgi:calmodulin
MDTLGIKASPEEIATMIKEIDVDNNGEIDFEEFVAVMSRKVNATYTPTEVKAAFKVSYNCQLVCIYISICDHDGATKG